MLGLIMPGLVMFGLIMLGRIRIRCIRSPEQQSLQCSNDRNFDILLDNRIAAAHAPVPDEINQIGNVVDLQIVAVKRVGRALGTRHLRWGGEIIRHDFSFPSEMPEDINALCHGR